MAYAKANCLFLFEQKLYRNRLTYPQIAAGQWPGLHTHEFMDAARHIYEATGFSILKEINPMFGKEYWL